MTQKGLFAMGKCTYDGQPCCRDSRYCRLLNKCEAAVNSECRLFEAVE